MQQISDPVLLISLSGRALARSAYAAKIPISVLDVFSDTDTRIYADNVCQVGDIVNGFNTCDLLLLADEQCPPRKCSGLVYGAGFESNPYILSLLSEKRKLFGNHPQVLANICTPEHFFSTLDRLNVPHPTVSYKRPFNPDSWLAKRIGASGGIHVQPANNVENSNDYYYQRREGGRVLSILFLANGCESEVVGISEQWNTETEKAPYGYAGAVSHQKVNESLYEEFKQLVHLMTQEWKLLGLNSIDLMLEGNSFKVLELNARPTATAELYDHDGQESLFKQHMKACSGYKLHYQGSDERMYSHRLIYAESDIHIPSKVFWPDWCSDRPSAGTEISQGDPICTVHACGNSLGSLNDYIQHRANFIHALFNSASLIPEGSNSFNTEMVM